MIPNEEDNERRERWHHRLRWLPWSWRMALIGPVYHTMTFEFDERDAMVLDDAVLDRAAKQIAQAEEEMVLNDSFFEEAWRATMPPHEEWCCGKHDDGLPCDSVRAMLQVRGLA